MTPPPVRHGGRILADQLRILGADRLFCVPGESFLGLLDGLHDHRQAIQTVSCRHESGAVNMAEAHAKLTGKPGLAAVTRGPGATNGSNGLHTAFHDSTPMILFVGQVERAMMDRGAFQEMDYRRVFGEMAKWIAQIDDTARIPEYVARAWATALAGRPGPVVLALPEETLEGEATVEDVRPHVPVESYPSPQALARLEELLTGAENPVMALGGPNWSPQVAEAAATFAEAQGLPVLTAFRRQDFIDQEHPHYAGTLGLGPNAKLIRRLKEDCDLVLSVGCRFSEIASQGYTLLGVPNPRQSLIFVHPSPEEHGAVHHGALEIGCGPAAFFEAAGALPRRAASPVIKEMRAEHEAFRTPPGKAPGTLDLAECMTAMRRILPEDAVVTNGAGNYSVWLHRFFPHRRHRTQLAPTSGSMGYGVPAAVAAKLAHPDRPAVCVAGDGCFLMTAQELATAHQYAAPIISIVVNNGMYGTIRMHQERKHPGRVEATRLDNPDFVMLAKAYRGEGERVERTEDFAPALERALAATGPGGRSYLIELVVDEEALTPVQTLSEARAQGEASLGARPEPADAIPPKEPEA